MKTLTCRSPGEAWGAALRECAAVSDGRIQHLVVAIAEPAPEPDPSVVEALAKLLRPSDHAVQTVANTLFPRDLYPDPEIAWHPTLSDSEVAVLDEAAEELYSSYELMLPFLLDADPGNQHGTYFSRMITWPGKEAGGFNQIAARIHQLRAKRRSGNRTFNASDIVIEGYGELEDLGGVEIYKAHDMRTMGFPCLVHLDLSLLNGKLSLLAVYRHWHLIRKGYGNLLGLSALQHFIAQQTGCDVGELLIHATVANAEFDTFNKGPVRKLGASLASESRHPTEVAVQV